MVEREKRVNTDRNMNYDTHINYFETLPTENED